MSQGLGRWQRAILAALEAEPEGVILAYILDPGTGDVPICIDDHSRAAFTGIYPDQSALRGGTFRPRSKPAIGNGRKKP